MTADGSSSLLFKTGALLLAGGAHALLFALIRLDVVPPPLAQPAATRVFILPAPEPTPILQEPAPPLPEPEPEPEPEPPPPLQQEESEVEVPAPEETEPEIPPQEPPPEPEPEPLPPEPEPEPEPPETPEPIAKPPQPPPEPEPPATPPEEPAPALPEPDVVEAPDDSDGEADVPPAPRRPIKPEYPLQARQEQWEGDVAFSVRISPRGRVLEAAVVQGSGHDVLDAAALKAVRAARFSPALKRGRPVELRVRLTVSFRLDERR